MRSRHDFICVSDSCNHVEQDIFCNDGTPSEPQVHCGKPMEICWQNLAPNVKVFTAFDTRNIHPDGRVMHIGSKGDLEFAAREYGCRHYDDPDLVAQGDEIVRKGSWNPTHFMDMGKR